ncbi:hypothetical protein LMG27952_06895 [Paraburkholderia hiiakae]|uniref:Uncharacterized protein n=1 Tax=Paraburkholderia hiiakae TaxID=1081782 RepID=A0ABM8P926_9BURK|nr:hypothetical protein [Paraburkholderia hiiakae]CAD6559561.1 hypothetical protein LMG27952_06895 [Paraburkholderia hiiakae]
MIIEAGSLDFVSVEFVRLARYRTRRQARSHRAPTYLVRYRLEGLATREAWVDPRTKPQLVWRIRSSHPQDFVTIELSANGNVIVEWTNQAFDALLNELGDTSGEAD